MQPIDSNLIAITLVIAYLTFSIFWVMYAGRRLSPLLRQKLGQSLGVTIQERFVGRGNQSWVISGDHTGRQSCLVSVGQFTVNVGCVVMPLFCALLMMGLLMFALTDS